MFSYSHLFLTFLPNIVPDIDKGVDWKLDRFFWYLAAENFLVFTDLEYRANIDIKFKFNYSLRSISTFQLL